MPNAVIHNGRIYILVDTRDELGNESCMEYRISINEARELINELELAIKESLLIT